MKMSKFRTLLEEFNKSLSLHSGMLHTDEILLIASDVEAEEHGIPENEHDTAARVFIILY
jgi:hypothetical protein